MRRGNGRLRETFPTPTTAVYGVDDPLLRRRAPRLLLPIQTKQKRRMQSISVVRDTSFMMVEKERGTGADTWRTRPSWVMSRHHDK